jgi:sensor histidine kinase YesM
MSHILVGGRDAHARAPRRFEALRHIRHAWRDLTWRQWAGAISVGFVCGLAQSVHYAVGQWARTPDAKLDIFISMASRWPLMLAGVACLLMFGLAALERGGRQTVSRPHHYALLILAVGAVSMLLVAPCVYLFSVLINTAGQVSSFTLHPSWPGALVWSVITGSTTFIMLSLWTLIHLHVNAARRTARALAAAQLRRADVERRILTEQLQSAQAMVEPAFLFDTLTLIEQSFLCDPTQAQRLLDELIRFLRAALPPVDDATSTLSQQADIVRAYLEIERIRSAGRFDARVDIPAMLGHRSLPPLLLLPLVANALRHGIRSRCGGEVTVCAREVDGALLVAVDDDGDGRVAAIREGAGLAGVRSRLVALCGEDARLVLLDREPRGIRARVEVTGAGRG